VGNLHRDVSDTTCTGVHQHRLPSMDSGAIHQTFPSSDENERKGRSLSQGKICRLLCQEMRVDGHECGERTLQTSDASSHPVDFVSGFECGHVWSDGLDDAGQIHPQNRRKLDARMGRVARPDFGIERVYATRLDANKYLALADDGKRNFHQSKSTVVTLKYKSTHGS
jgi:hypothetical protein